MGGREDNPMSTTSNTTIDAFLASIAHIPLTVVDRRRTTVVLTTDEGEFRDHVAHALEITANRAGLKVKAIALVGTHPHDCWTVAGFAKGEQR